MTPIATEHPPEVTARGVPQPRGITYNDRVIVFGTSGSGKSTLVNHIANRVKCQVLLYDTKDELIVPGVEPVTQPEQLRWNERVMHLVDDSCDLRDVRRLFDLCWRRASGRVVSGKYGLVVVVHELGDLCTDQPNMTPRSVTNYIKKGRQRGLGLIAASQRPVNIPKSARTEIQHVMTFAGGLDPDDLPTAAKMHRMSVAEFERTLEDIHNRYGHHAYIWQDREARRNVIRPALPEHLRKDVIAKIIDPLEKPPETTPETPDAND